MIVERDLRYTGAVRAAQIHNDLQHNSRYIAHIVPTHDTGKSRPALFAVVCLVCAEPEETDEKRE